MCYQCQVDYNGKVIGNLIFITEKLYYRYEGYFSLNKESMFRVFAIIPSGQINLGVCTPLDGQWYLHGRIAKKNLNLDEAHFVIVDDSAPGKFITVNEDKPFNHLEFLAQCRFRQNEDCAEIFLLEND